MTKKATPKKTVITIGTAAKLGKIARPPIKATTRGSTPEDGFIGQKVRIRRAELGISQSELGEKLGVSFQQVQKYEKGVNRISAGRLLQIARVLEVSTDYFYDKHSKSENDVQSLLYTDPKFSLRLLRAYAKLPLEQQRHIVSLMEAMAGEELAAE